MHKENYFRKIICALLLACILLVSAGLEIAFCAGTEEPLRREPSVEEKSIGRPESTPKGKHRMEEVLPSGLEPLRDKNKPPGNEPKPTGILKRPRIASDYTIRKRNNAEAARMMPADSVIIDVLQAGTIQIVSGIRSYEINNLEELSKIDELQHAKRVLLTHRADNSEVANVIRMLFPEKNVLFSNPDIKVGAKATKALFEETLKTDDSAVAFLFPRNAEQQEKQGLMGWTTKDREDAWRARDYFLTDTKIPDIITDINRGGPLEWFKQKIKMIPPVHDQLIKYLQKEKGVYIFFCHGTREELRLPDGDVLTAKEISELNLSNKPLVFLFSCEGGKLGPKNGGSISLEGAFKKAGAEAVLSFPVELAPGNAASYALELYKRLEMGMPILEAIEKTMHEYQKIDIESRFMVEVDSKLPYSRETGTGFLVYG
jgi:hypothetical protein